MSKSVMKGILVLSAVGGLIYLGVRAQRYAKLFWALSREDDDTETKSDEPTVDIDELLRTGDAIRVRVSPVPDKDSEDEVE